MGCGGSKANAQAEQKNAEIERQIAVHEKELQHEAKLLLLGAGESGKSTIAKQLRIINNKPFSQEEILSYKPIIFQNCIQSMGIILKAMSTLEKPVEHSSPAMEALAEKVLDYSDDLVTLEASFPADIADAIKELWKDSKVQEAYAERKEYQLGDSANYLFSNIDRFQADDFVPSQEDVLHSRVKTTGIVETRFQHEDMTYKMFDLGGQRCERKKWLHCFEKVTAIIFCAALSEYDLTLIEDESVNRMQESLVLFQSISNSKWFTDTSIILFLNKKDLFEVKIEKSPLTICFPEYDQPNENEPARNFIKDKFEELAPKGKDIYTHFTCATDTSNVQFVFNSISNIIIKDIFERCDLV